MTALHDINTLWIEKATSLNPGEKLFIESDSAKAQRRLERDLTRARDTFSLVNPVESSKISIRTTYKDRKFWVVLLKLASSPLIGYKKDAAGDVVKITLGVEPEQQRRLKLMRQDGLSPDEIAEIEGRPLTEAEKSILGLIDLEEEGEGEEDGKESPKG
jgi:hypothetical protein